ncbi:MAG: shikimate dehydrogenase family protein [Thermoplasmata archaeon]
MTTRLTGLIGTPVEQSWGKYLFNRVYREMDMDSFYIPMDITPDLLEDFLKYASPAFIGYNVTSPLKEKVVKYVDQLDRIARETGSVNLVRNNGGRTCGYNTDYAGFSYLVDRNGIEFEGKSVCIAGTGGVFRTVFRYISSEFSNVALTVLSSNAKNASRKLRHLEGYEDMVIVEREDLADASFDILVNCTPLGMKNYEAALPFPETLMDRSTVGIDLVYNPTETPFLKYMKANGKTVVNGVKMYLGQALESFRILFQQEPERERFESIIDDLVRQ